MDGATSTARAMVTRYGFSDNLGPIVYGQGDHEVFLGRDYTNTPSYSDNVAAEIDNEIRTIVETAFENAERVLTEHMDQLHILAKYLMKHEKSDGIKFEKLMKGEIPASEYEDVKDETVDLSKKETVSDDVVNTTESKDTVLEDKEDTNI